MSGASLTADKALEVHATVSERETATATLHPFANRELTAQERGVLEAERVANAAAARNGGRPTVAGLLQLSEALANAGEHARAAETLEVVQILDKNADYANTISCHYSRAGREGLCDRWNEVAYERRRVPANAHNLALTKLRAGDVEGYGRLMEEALSLDPAHSATRVSYGRHLKGKGVARGTELLEAAFESLKARDEASVASTSELRLLAQAADALGRGDIAKSARARSVERSSAPALFDEDKLLTQNLDLPVRQP